MKKRRPGKPQGMNYIQAQQHRKAVFNGLVDIAAQQQLLERSDFLQQEVTTRRSLRQMICSILARSGARRLAS